MTHAPIWRFNRAATLAAVAALCLEACGAHDAPAPTPDAGDAVDLAALDHGEDESASWTVDGSVGGACQVNADCATSPAAEAAKGIRCTGKDIYCLAGTCHAECRETCMQVRTDINPCPAPRICNPLGNLGESFCSLTPAPCQIQADCPTYQPLVDGAPAEWSCAQGYCQYPGLDPPTH